MHVLDEFVPWLMLRLCCSHQQSLSPTHSTVLTHSLSLNTHRTPRSTSDSIPDYTVDVDSCGNSGVLPVLSPALSSEHPLLGAAGAALAGAPAGPVGEGSAASLHKRDEGEMFDRLQHEYQALLEQVSSMKQELPKMLERQGP